MKKQSKVIRIVYIFIVMAVGVIFSLSLSCDQKSPKEDYKIRVGYKGNSGYQVLFVAEAKELFTKHEVHVEKQEFESTELMFQAISLGQIDATPAGNLETIAKVDKKSPDLFNIYLTLVFDKENAFFSILVPPNTQITSLADLKGKKVGTIPGATASGRLKACLMNFFDPNETVIIQLKPQIQLQALIAGEVDALYTMDPIVTISQVKNLAKVLMKGPENEYMFSPQATAGAVIGTQFVTNHEESARRFILAMNEAVDFMRKNEAETRRIVAAAAKLDIEVADRISLIKYWKLDETNFDSVKRYLDFTVDVGILDNAPDDVKTLYLPASFLESKRKED